MFFHRGFVIFIALTLGLQMPYSRTFAAEKQKAQPTKDTKKVDALPPGESEYPWWIEGLRTRFSVVASGLRLLQDEIDIDAAVGGNPWTLRRDTLGALKFLPVKIQLGLAQFMINNIGPIVLNDDHVRIDDRQGAPPQLYAPANLSADFALTEDMSRSLIQTSVLDQLRRALSEEQMIDLAVYLLSRHSFFPKENDWAAWGRIKKKIIYYDIYLILAVITLAIMFDKGQLKVTGYLFKINGEQFRVGWYGSLKNLGAHLKSPEFKAGFKIKGEGLNAEIGVKKKLSPTEQTAIEANIASQIFTQLLKPMGWGSDISFNVSHIVSDQLSPSNEGMTHFGFGSAVRNDRLRPGKSLGVSVGSSFSVNTQGHPNANVTAILNDEKYGFDLSASVNVGEETGRSGNLMVNTRVGLVAHYQWDAGAKHLIYALKTDGDTIRALMSQIEKIKQGPDDYVSRGNLTILRESLKLRVSNYIEEATRMIEMLHPSERFFPISDQEFALALLESQLEITDPVAKERAQKLMEKLYFHN